MKHIIVHSLLALLAFSRPLPSFAQGTAFSYQGRLTANGSPANGGHELRFGLFGSATNGNPIGVAVTNAPVMVADGLFIATLDFGAAAFDGPPRWLEIAVRRSGGTNGFATLEPRQPLLAAPYAVHAATASNLLGNSMFTGKVTFNPTSGPPFMVSNALRVDQLNADLLDGLDSTAFAQTNHEHAAESIVSGVLSDARLSTNVAFLNGRQTFTGSNRFDGVSILTNAANLFAGGFNGDGAGLTNINVTNLAGTLPDSLLSSNILRLDAGARFTGLMVFEPTGGGSPFAVGEPGKVENLNSDLFDNMDSSAFWKAGGNEGTIAGTNFLGTTDEQALELKVNGQRAFRLEPTTGSPNVIGGFAGNSVPSGARGVTIAGGGVEDGVNAAVRQFGTPNYSTIGGGANNAVWASKYATVAGGFGNVVKTGAYPGNWDYETIAGGFGNRAEDSPGATISGGMDNRVTYFSRSATIGGGEGNLMSAGFLSTIGGGAENFIFHRYGTIGGGAFNVLRGGQFADFQFSTVAGGLSNAIVNTSFATIGGGVMNSMNINSHGATIAGGQSNTTFTARCAAVGGGAGNVAAGEFATVPGGQANVATNYSLAAGRNAKALHTGSFVWGDSTDADVASTANDQFTVRAAGGARFLSDTNGSSGVELAPGSGAWSSLSDRNAKRNFVPIEPRQILEKLVAVPIQQWSYKSQDASVRHIGPTAQDFHAAFNVGEDERRIATVDADGVALAAIQGLNEIVREQKAELKAKEASRKRATFFSQKATAIGCSPGRMCISAWSGLMTAAKLHAFWTATPFQRLTRIFLPKPNITQPSV